MKLGRILIFFEYGSLNGGEFSLLAMLERLVKSGEYEFVASCPATGRLTERLQSLGIEVLPLKLRGNEGVKMGAEQISSHLMAIVERVRPDLVHSNSLAMGRMVGRIAMELAVPCTTHLRDIIRLNKTVVKDLNGNAGLIAVSSATRDYHVAQGIARTKTYVIYNGVDSDMFIPSRAGIDIRRELGLDDNVRLCANIGQICLRKGQHLLARSAVKLASEFPDMHYLFIGQRHSQKPESVEYEAAIGDIFRQAGIEDRLHCLGFRKDVPTILNEIDILVHAAHQEPLGRVLLEAASCGVVIVATDVGGTSEILTDGVSGILVPADDVNALAFAMLAVLNDEKLQEHLRSGSRKVAMEKFSLETATNKVASFWREFAKL